MIRFARPEAFLLAVPILLLLKGRLGSRGFVAVLRALALLTALGALAEPWLPGAATGRDVVFVVDRSASMPEESAALVAETLKESAAAAKKGDRAGVVLFGRSVVVETPPTEGFRPAEFQKDVDRDGSDLAKALDQALASIPPGRRGSIVVLSDGEATGRSAHDVARAAARRDVRIDVRPARRRGVSDVRVEEISLPGEVDLNEPFQWSIWVRSDRATTAPVRVYRDGTLIAESTRDLKPGLNRFVFRDRVAESGVRRYEAEVDVGDDRVKENNRALGVVRVEGSRRLLALTPGGREDRLTRTLRAAGFDVVASAPEAAPLRPEELDAFRAVVLENVPAARLPRGANAALRSYVEDFGGGLLMTGGRASFGAGGYRKTEIEKALPVSLEARREQRKSSLAMSVALDRSGSMGAPAGVGLTKMDLANRGTVEAIKLLSSSDSISVIAVDSAPHVVVKQGPVDDPAAIAERVRKIESGGGGIFVGEALHAAADQLATTTHLNKHVVLFADAADAEEPGDYLTFVPELARHGVTVSVIGLGTEGDVDAELLKKIAVLGGGRCFFTAEASELPKVFADETMQVARSTFVDAPTAVVAKPDLVAIGDLGGFSFPTIGGYSITYLRQDGLLGAAADDETGAPIFAFRQAGLGRSAVFTGEVDGPSSGGLAAWDRFDVFFNTVARRLSGGDLRSDVFAEFTRDGHDGVLSVEVEPGKEALLAAATAKIAAPNGEPTPVVLTRVGERRLEARVPLDKAGVYRAAIDSGDKRSIRTAPLALPYSPEYAAPVDPETGPRLLAALAEATGGRVDPPFAETFDGPRESSGYSDLAAWFALAAILLLVAEIAVRRLDVPAPSFAFLRKIPTPRFRRAAKDAGVGARGGRGGGAGVESVGGGASAVDEGEASKSPTKDGPPGKSPSTRATDAANAPNAPSSASDALGDALAEAKRRARRR